MSKEEPKALVCRLERTREGVVQRTTWPREITQAQQYKAVPFYPVSLGLRGSSSDVEILPHAKASKAAAGEETFSR